MFLTLNLLLLSNLSGLSFRDYLKSELRRGYLLENDEERYTARREKVYTFFKIPREVSIPFIHSYIIIPKRIHIYARSYITIYQFPLLTYIDYFVTLQCKFSFL